MSNFLAGVKCQIVEFVKELCLSAVRGLIYLALLLAVFVLPVLLGVFVKYLGFFN
jgi:hypothetical protein